jgi:hypothetical protein
VPPLAGMAKLCPDLIQLRRARKGATVAGGAATKEKEKEP